MVWQFNENIPIYRQVVTQLRGKIISGEYKPGEYLPTVRCLSEEAKINPNTVQRAFHELEKMGLAVCFSTSGRKVTTDMAVIQEQRKAAAKELADYAVQAAKEIGMSAKELADMLCERKA